jgi:hypothetical protein
MIATDDGVRTNVATIHELQIVYNGGERRMFDILKDGYAGKGGTNSTGVLPGGCGGPLATAGNDPQGVPYGCGRADIRLAQGGDGEIYVLSKSDGMIRKLFAAIAPPLIQSVTWTNGEVTLAWPSISNHHYRVQFSSSLSPTNWADLAGDVTATNALALKTDVPGVTSRFYRVIILP